MSQQNPSQQNRRVRRLSWWLVLLSTLGIFAWVVFGDEPLPRSDDLAYPFSVRLSAELDPWTSTRQRWPDDAAIARDLGLEERGLTETTILRAILPDIEFADWIRFREPAGVVMAWEAHEDRELLDRTRAVANDWIDELIAQGVLERRGGNPATPGRGDHWRHQGFYVLYRAARLHAWGHGENDRLGQIFAVELCELIDRIESFDPATSYRFELYRVVSRLHVWLDRFRRRVSDGSLDGQLETFVPLLDSLPSLEELWVRFARTDYARTRNVLLDAQARKKYFEDLAKNGGTGDKKLHLRIARGQTHRFKPHRLLRRAGDYTRLVEQFPLNKNTDIPDVDLDPQWLRALRDPYGNKLLWRFL